MLSATAAVFHSYPRQPLYVLRLPYLVYAMRYTAPCWVCDADEFVSLFGIALGLRLVYFYSIASRSSVRGSTAGGCQVAYVETLYETAGGCAALKQRLHDERVRYIAQVG